MYTNYSSCLLSLFLLIIVNYIELQPVNAAACNESNTLELCPAGCYNSLIHNENDSYSLQNETNYLPGIDPSYTDRVCSSVPSGKYSPINDDNMYLCPDGTYSLNGSSNCTLCPRGSYNFGIGSSSCYKCSPGSYTNLLGSKQCLKCQPIIYFGIGTYNVKFEKDINGGGDDNNAICLPPDIATYTPTSVPTTFLPSSKPLSISISQRPIKKNEISNPTKNNNSKNPVKIKSSTISPIQSKLNKYH